MYIYIYTYILLIYQGVITLGDDPNFHQMEGCTLDFELDSHIDLPRNGYLQPFCWFSLPHGFDM